MTVREAKNKLIAWAEAQIGTREGANNYNRYARGMQKLYGWDVQNQPWCDIFVDAGFVECFGLELAMAMTYQFPGCAGAACRYSAQYYKDAGAWVAAPEPGDQIFFYSGGGINHTGIVVEVNGARVKTVEGNSSDRVMTHAYTIGDGYIAGYGRPDWSVFEDGGEVNNGSSNATVEPPKEDVCEVTVTLPIIKYGDEGLAVKVMQTLLIGKGYSCGWYGADGEYGDQTRIGLYEFQSAHGLAADTVAGQRTWELLLSF